MYAMAAERQGKFMEMKHKIFENYKQLRSNEDLPRQYAQEFGLDMVEYHLAPKRVSLWSLKNLLTLMTSLKKRKKREKDMLYLLGSRMM